MYKKMGKFAVAGWMDQSLACRTISTSIFRVCCAPATLYIDISAKRLRLAQLKKNLLSVRGPRLVVGLHSELPSGSDGVCDQ
jgi:hypothetical protein